MAERSGLPTRSDQHLFPKSIRPVGLPSRRACPSSVQPHRPRWLSAPAKMVVAQQQRTLSVAIPFRGSSGPLHLLIDSTGIKAEGEGEWNARKHGGAKRRIWRKIHIGIDEETLEIRSIEVTS